MAAPLPVMIVDDSKAARSRLRDLLAESTHNIEAIETKYGLHDLEQIAKHRPQLVLLNISTAGMKGVELARRIAASSPRPEIVFVSASDRFALEAFEVGARDYLLEPVQPALLERALERTLGSSMTTQQTESPGPNHRSHFLVSAKGTEQIIPLDEIIYFKADSKYIAVRAGAEAYLVNEVLAVLETELGDRFLRIHRNALVSKRHIAGLERGSKGNWRIFFRDIEDRLKISRRYKPAVSRWFRRQK